MSAPDEPSRPLRVAVLGASGIGRYIVRELARAGAEVVAIQGSTPDSAARTAASLAERYKVDPRPCTELDEVLALDLDAVAVATPHELHYDATVRALLAGLAVFCEKPLFWSGDLDDALLRARLAELAMAGAAERLCVNTSNSTFVARLRELGQVPAEPRRFDFELTTRGADRGEEIAADLLPHALSLLFEFATPGAAVRTAALEAVEARAGEHEFVARFRLAPTETDCRLHLAEFPDGEKAMRFRLNDSAFARVQRTDEDDVYRVALDGPTGEHPVPDPFEAVIGAFVRAARTGGPMPIDFDTSAAILAHSLALVEAARGPSQE